MLAATSKASTLRLLFLSRLQGTFRKPAATIATITGTESVVVAHAVGHRSTRHAYTAILTLDNLKPKNWSIITELSRIVNRR